MIKRVDSPKATKPFAHMVEKAMRKALRVIEEEKGVAEETSGRRSSVRRSSVRRMFILSVSCWDSIVVVAETGTIFFVGNYY